MDKSLFFWIIFIVAAILGIGGPFYGPWGRAASIGAWIVLLLLIGILGWAAFGPIVR
jgi:hypothetical protein